MESLLVMMGLSLLGNFTLGFYIVIKFVCEIIYVYGIQ